MVSRLFFCILTSATPATGFCHGRRIGEQWVKCCLMSWLVTLVANSMLSFNQAECFRVSSVLMRGFGRCIVRTPCQQVQFLTFSPTHKACNKGRLIGLSRLLLGKKVWLLTHAPRRPVSDVYHPQLPHVPLLTATLIGDLRTSLPKCVFEVDFEIFTAKTTFTISFLIEDDAMYRRLIAACLIWCSTFGISLAQETRPISEAIEDIGANVVFMRHAIAPGFGDPVDFVVGDCATQRNLSHEGKIQARDIGDALKQQGIAFDAVYSSEWCRCTDTAELMDTSPVQRFAGLNSFFQSHAPKDETLELLKSKLERLPSDTLTLMVTHQVVIQAMTSMSVSSGGLIAYNTVTQQAVRVTAM